MVRARPSRFTAFEGPRRLASGTLPDVSVPAARATARRGAAVLVFDDTTGRLVDLDLRGSEQEVRDRARRLAARIEGGSEPAASPPRRGPGRPRLGVVGKEVTLLPRHWAWLNAQPGGASATLRRLVERARRENEGRDQTRQARDVVYRFLQAMAGDRPGYEEALRALYRGDRPAFLAQIARWPADLLDHTRRLAEDAFGGPPGGGGAPHGKS